MTIIHDFSDNENLADSKREPVSALNIDHYIEGNNFERVLGYLEAMEDFKNQLEQAYTKHRHTNNGVIYVQPYSEAKILKNIMQLNNEKYELLKSMKLLIENRRSSGPEQTPAI